MKDDIAVKINHVSKDFSYGKLNSNTLKGILVDMFKSSSDKKKTRKNNAQHALRDISFEVKKGEFFGIVGRNGSGKSTLLKIIAGIYQPNKGNVQVNGKLVPFIELGVGFNPELTGRENVYLNGALLGFDSKEIDGMYDEIVKFAELEKFMDKKLKNYSSGMQVRLAFSMAIRAKADILLIDEVLAVGDADFQRKCFSYFKRLRKEGVTVILVTHDMSAVREFCDKAVLINDSRVISLGPPKEIALKYSQLFQQLTTGEIITNKKVKSKRTGDNMLNYVSVKSPKSIKQSDSSIAIEALICANMDVGNVNLGFEICDDGGVTILGTNTDINNDTTISLKKGEQLSLVWEVPNIFEDGEYHVSLAAVYDGGVIADWWDEASKFSSFRDRKTPHTISPKINFIINPKEKS